MNKNEANFKCLSSFKMTYVINCISHCERFTMYTYISEKIDSSFLFLLVDVASSKMIELLLLSRYIKRMCVPPRLLQENKR